MIILSSLKGIMRENYNQFFCIIFRNKTKLKKNIHVFLYTYFYAHVFMHMFFPQLIIILLIFVYLNSGHFNIEKDCVQSLHAYNKNAKKTFLWKKDVL